MSIQAWQEIIHRKSFYVQTYRRTITALFISLILNAVLGLGLYFAYLIQPEPEFYATSGVTQPLKLTARLAPNELSTALLAPDPLPENEQPKAIPQ